MKARQKRTLKKVVDLDTMRPITSDELLAMDQDDYQIIRRSATRARLDRKPRYVCNLCGDPVYAPRESRSGRPYWKHHAGASTECHWWTGTPSTVDDVSGRQFNGAQESPLHEKFKNVVGDLLLNDPRTQPGSVVVDKYLIGESGKRRPDVRAVYDGANVTMEIQLTTTQIPIIIQREDFYEKEGYRLLWVTWDFEPPTNGNRLRSSFEDIFYSHNKNIFSMDSELILLSQRAREIFLRVFWENHGSWLSKITRLSELNWLPNGRAFAIAPEPSWHEDFLTRWRVATSDHGTRWPESARLLAELVEHLAPPHIGADDIDESGIADLINCLLSLTDGHPVGSRQNNIVELLNTFLSAQRRHRFARVIQLFAGLCGQKEVLDVKSVRAKLETALKAYQEDLASFSGRVALRLFPHVFARAGQA